MGFFDFFKPKDPSYEEITQERSALKKEISDTLRELKFTSLEIKQVMVIVDQAEAKISVLKAQLVGSNVSNHNPKKLEEHVHKKIQDVMNQMNIDMRSKVQEILARKQGKK